MPAKKQQSLPHFGVKNGMSRKGSTITAGDGKQTSYKSITKAKRFMRTGNPDK